MKERPILFSGPMVRAILDGRKTQTRRVVKDSAKHNVYLLGDNACGVLWDHCPYGQPGDRLWVRETWAHISRCEHYNHLHDSTEWLYKADGSSCVSKWTPSIHMPRFASRILLEVTAVRVERLQEISRDDAIQEGIEHLHRDVDVPTLNPWRNYLQGQPGEMIQHCSCPRRSFQTLWDLINAKRAPWDSNPWVWVVEFKRITP